MLQQVLVPARQMVSVGTFWFSQVGSRGTEHPLAGQLLRDVWENASYLFLFCDCLFSCFHCEKNAAHIAVHFVPPITQTALQVSHNQ